MILAALIAWAGVTVVLADAPSWGWRGLGALALCAFGGWWAGMLSPRAWRFVQLLIAALALGQIGWMAMQATGYDPLFVGVRSPGTGHAAPDPSLPVPVQGWFGNATHAALFVALTLPALWALHPVASGLGLVALVSLKSTAAVGAAIVFLVVLAWRVRGWTWGVSAGLVSAAAAFVFVRALDPAGLGDKPLIWSLGLQVIGAQWLTGYGLNTLGYQVAIWSSAGRIEVLYSDWLQWTLETGVVGLALALAYLGWLTWRVVRTWPAGTSLLAPALMVLLLSLISIPMRLIPTAALSAVYLGRLHAEVDA